jgi:hypothetical protein
MNEKTHDQEYRRALRVVRLGGRWIEVVTCTCAARVHAYKLIEGAPDSTIPHIKVEDLGDEIRSHIIRRLGLNVEEMLLVGSDK